MAVGDVCPLCQTLLVLRRKLAVSIVMCCLFGRWASSPANVLAVGFHGQDDDRLETAFGVGHLDGKRKCLRLNAYWTVR